MQSAFSFPQQLHIVDFNMKSTERETRYDSQSCDKNNNNSESAAECFGTGRTNTPASEK